MAVDARRKRFLGVVVHSPISGLNRPVRRPGGLVMPRAPGTNRGILGAMRRIDDWDAFERNKAATAFWYWQASSGAYPALDGAIP